MVASRPRRRHLLIVGRSRETFQTTFAPFSLQVVPRFLGRTKITIPSSAALNSGVAAQAADGRPGAASGVRVNMDALKAAHLSPHAYAHLQRRFSDPPKQPMTWTGRQW